MGLICSLQFVVFHEDFQMCRILQDFNKIHAVTVAQCSSALVIV